MEKPLFLKFVTFACLFADRLVHYPENAIGFQPVNSLDFDRLEAYPTDTITIKAMNRRVSCQSEILRIGFNEPRKIERLCCLDRDAKQTPRIAVMLECEVVVSENKL